GRVLRSVREQVTDDLRETTRIPDHEQPFRGHIDDEVVRTGIRSSQLRLLSEKRRKIEPGQVQDDPGAIELAGAEEIINQVLKPSTLLVNDSGVLGPGAVVERARQHEPCVSEDARQWRSDLVGDDRDQLRFRPLALSKFFVLRLEAPPFPRE